jgi:hypothetical protein
MTAEAAIFLLKVLHTAVFFLASGCVLYALRCGIVGRASCRLLLLAIAVPTAIGILWWLNGRECLLSSMIYRLAGGDRTIADIFLPEWFARWIMAGSTSLLVVAVGLVPWRQLTQGWRARSSDVLPPTPRM